MYTLTKADGANPLYNLDNAGNVESWVEEIGIGLSWERKAAPGENSGIGKAKAWMDRKKREARGETDASDLDAGALFFVGDKPTRYLGFDNFEPFKDEASPRERQSAAHSGDNTTGDGDGDDELIRIKLQDIPARFTKILFVVGAYKQGSDIRAARDIKATVYDYTGGSGQAMAQIEPSLLDDKDILAIASVEREPNGERWTLTVADASFNITKGDIRSLLRASINAF